WLSRDTASSVSPRRSRSTNSDFRWTLQRSGSSASFGGLDGSGGVADFLGFVPMSGLLGHGHPSQLRVPRNRVRFMSQLFAPSQFQAPLSSKPVPAGSRTLRRTSPQSDSRAGNGDTSSNPHEPGRRRSGRWEDLSSGVQPASTTA